MIAAILSHLVTATAIDAAPLVPRAEPQHSSGHSSQAADQSNRGSRPISDLDTGEIVGLSIGLTAAAFIMSIVVAQLVVWLLKRRKKARAQQQQRRSDRDEMRRAKAERASELRESQLSSSCLTMDRQAMTAAWLASPAVAFNSDGDLEGSSIPDSPLPAYAKEPKGYARKGVTGSGDISRTSFELPPPAYPEGTGEQDSGNLRY